MQTAQLRPTGQESRLVLVGGEEPKGKDASEGNNKDFPNLGHHSLERDVPVTSWPIVGHAGMVLPGCGDGSELPEPALLARGRSGAGVAGTFCSEPVPDRPITMSHATGCSSCGFAVSRVAKFAKKRKECDTTTRRPAVALATETNRVPNCTAKVAQRRQSGIGTRFMKGTVSFHVYIGSLAQLGCLPPPVLQTRIRFLGSHQPLEQGESLESTIGKASLAGRPAGRSYSALSVI